eukprot:4033009-Alexandrium_andersonii.AAC.1
MSASLVGSEMCIRDSARTLLVAPVCSTKARDLLHDADLSRREALRTLNVQACAGILHHDTRARERFHPRSSPPNRFRPK